MASKESQSSILGKLGLRPITRSSIINFYLPVQGFVSYSALSVNVINPKLGLTFLPKRDVTNILLFNTIVGSGLYIYGRKHMENLDKDKRLLYSAFGAVIFSLGSVLFWAVLRGSIPVQSTGFGISLGLLTSVGLVKLGTGYLQEMDRITKK